MLRMQETLTSLAAKQKNMITPRNAAEDNGARRA